MLKRTTARGILFMHNSRGEKCIALIKRIRSNQPEYYVVPGGGVEGNETVFQTVEREMCEELGIKCKALEIVERRENATSIDFFILCKYIEGRFGTGTGPEYNNPIRKIERGQYNPVLVTIEELPKINIVPVDLCKVILKYK